MYASYGACWPVRGDYSPLTTPRQPLRFFYIAERAARARAFWLSLFFFRSRLASLFQNAFVSAGALLSFLPAHCISSPPALSVSSLPALCSLLSSLVLSLVSALLSTGVLHPCLPALSSRLCFASV